MTIGGGIAGIAVGVLLSRLITWYAAWPTSISAASVAAAVTISVGGRHRLRALSGDPGGRLIPMDALRRECNRAGQAAARMPREAPSSRIASTPSRCQPLAERQRQPIAHLSTGADVPRAAGLTDRSDSTRRPRPKRRAPPGSTTSDEPSRADGAQHPSVPE